jgi:hypothetical protein
VDRERAEPDCKRRTVFGDDLSPLRETLNFEFSFARDNLWLKLWFRSKVVRGRL